MFETGAKNDRPEALRDLGRNFGDDGLQYTLKSVF